MFGATIDYWILRPLTHNRKLEADANLDARFGQQTSVDMNAAESRFQKLQNKLQGRFPIQPDLRYLDIGCGTGDITLALAKLGASHVTGLDIIPRCTAAATANAQKLGLSDRVEFVCRDVHDWTPPRPFDVIMSHEALEHIHDVKGFLARLHALMAPDGIAVLAFGPLFSSPFGDHMDAFFRVPIPWRGVLFSEKAVLRLRRQQFRPTDPASRYSEIVGGLNLLRYSEFLGYVEETGWKFDFLSVNPQLRKIPLLSRISDFPNSYALHTGLHRVLGVHDSAPRVTESTFIHARRLFSRCESVRDHMSATSTKHRLLVLGNGSSIHTQKWIEGLAFTGEWDIELITMNPTPPLAGLTRIPALQHIQQIAPAQVNERGNNYQYLYNLQRLRRHIQSFDPAVISTLYLSSYGIIGALLKGRAKLVQFVLGTDVMVFPDQSWIKRAAARFALRRSDFVVSASRTMTAKLAGELGVARSHILTQQYGVNEWLLELPARNRKYDFVSNRAWIS